MRLGEGQFVGVGIYLTKDVTNNKRELLFIYDGQAATESGIKVVI